MNPVLLVIVILIFANPGKGQKFISKLGGPPLGPAYVDTFKMELILDKLHHMTNTLEKVNHLNQMRNIPLTKNNALDRVQESLDAVKGLLSEGKSGKQLNTLSNTISSVKKFGDIESMISSMGPILSMLSNNEEK